MWVLRELEFLLSGKVNFPLLLSDQTRMIVWNYASHQSLKGWLSCWHIISWLSHVSYFLLCWVVSRQNRFYCSISCRLIFAISPCIALSLSQSRLCDPWLPAAALYRSRINIYCVRSQFREELISIGSQFPLDSTVTSQPRLTHRQEQRTTFIALGLYSFARSLNFLAVGCTDSSQIVENSTTDGWAIMDILLLPVSWPSPSCWNVCLKSTFLCWELRCS